MRQLIASMQETGDVPTCAVMVDGDPYDIEWPAHWKIHYSRMHLEMQSALNELFSLYPQERYYGIFADHARPKTPNWCQELVDIAGSNRVAIADCGKTIVNPSTGVRRMNSPCIGGDLVRAVGWIWLPTVVHMYGDDAWEDIAYGLDLVEYAPQVKILDLLKRDGEVEVDENHMRLFRGKPYVEHDRQAYVAWKRNTFPALIDRLRQPCVA